MQVRASSTAVRQQLFELEHGVCVKCGVDAHKVYAATKVLHPHDRAAHIQASPFANCSLAMRQRMVNEPSPGLFWQADHIVPVVEGGGQCSLFNYRTLCTPCHAAETSALRDRLRRAQMAVASAGTADIRHAFAAEPAAPKRPREQPASSPCLQGIDAFARPSKRRRPLVVIDLD